MEAESLQRYNSILDIIDKRLIPDEGAKAARGEVFTPLSLVREMLFGLRKSALEKKEIEVWGIDKDGNFFDDDESDRVGGIPLPVWQNCKSTFLDPANGIGNFPVVAFYMLDYQLGKHGNEPKYRGDKNKDARRKHIVENMLYMIELNKGNVNTSRKIFEKIAPGTKANICCANTLSLDDDKLKKQLGINRFDVIMGNPPFNEGGTKHHEDRGFYTKFIKYGYNLINKDGYLIFVHPPNYHRIDKDDQKKGIVVKQLFNENNLLFLRIIANTKDYFDVQIAIDYYILQKSNNKSEAIILDKHNILTTDINISIFETVPNFGFNIIKKLVKLQNKNGKFVAKIGRDSDKHSSRKELFTNGKFKIIHLINEDGMRIKLSNTPHKYQNINKVIINGLGVPYVLDDKNKEYGTSEAPNYVLEPSKKEKIFLFSKLFQYLNWAYRIQGNKNDRYFFDIMPDLNKFNYTDENTMIKALSLEKDLEEINKYNVPEFKNIEKIEKAGEGKAPKTARATKPKKGGAPTSRFTQTRKNRKH